MAALGGVSPDYHVVLHVSTKTSGLVARNVVFVTILAPKPSGRKRWEADGKRLAGSNGTYERCTTPTLICL